MVFVWLSYQSMGQAVLGERGYGRANPNFVLIRDSMAGPEVDITEMEMDEWLETIYRIRPGDANIKAWEQQVYQRLALPKERPLSIKCPYVMLSKIQELYPHTIAHPRETK